MKRPVLFLFAFSLALFLASDANAGFFKRLKDRRSGCSATCSAGSCDSASACAAGACEGCTVANLNGVGIPTTVTFNGKQYTQTCVNGVCKLTEITTPPQPAGTEPKSSGPESIVIDGKSYLLVPAPRTAAKR